ncbi:hypothetical protein DW201_13350 [Enterococcus casseliflavus]|nr:hypothetical protein DW201_13350 [Enterococcus casseliflavus]
MDWIKQCSYRFFPCLDKISVGMIELISGKSPFKRCRISKNSANKIICVIFEGHLFIFLIIVYF